jgi:hypothetical protein
MSTLWSEFHGVHIRALIVKIQENINKRAILQYEVLELKR